MNSLSTNTVLLDLMNYLKVVLHPCEHEYVFPEEGFSSSEGRGTATCETTYEKTIKKAKRKLDFCQLTPFCDLCSGLLGESGSVFCRTNQPGCGRAGAWLAAGLR